MNYKYWLLIPFLICCSATVHSQIQSGLYSDSDKMYGSFRFVVVKGDTAFSESTSQKHGHVWIYEHTLDTLIRQNDNSYLGNKYVLKQKDGTVYLVEKKTKRKRETPLKIANNLVSIRNGIHNRYAMSKMGIYNKYYLTLQYLRETSQNTDDIINAYYELEQKQDLDEESFLIEMKKFETKYLYRKIRIEE